MVKVYGVQIMHNILSKNQLADWNHFETPVAENKHSYEALNDYYDCLISCESDGQPKRICKEILRM